MNGEEHIILCFTWIDPQHICQQRHSAGSSVLPADTPPIPTVVKTPTELSSLPPNRRHPFPFPSRGAKGRKAHCPPPPPNSHRCNRWCRRTKSHSPLRPVTIICWYRWWFGFCRWSGVCVGALPSRSIRCWESVARILWQ